MNTNNWRNTRTANRYRKTGIRETIFNATRTEDTYRPKKLRPSGSDSFWEALGCTLLWGLLGAACIFI